MKRRQFLKGTAGVIGGIPVVAIGTAPSTDRKAYQTSYPKDGHIPRWGMVMDLRKCIGCQACTAACGMENGLQPNQHRTQVPVYEIDAPSGPSMATLPKLCNHCANPPCIPVCPVSATYQTIEGLVVIDSDQCVGCGYCVQACPYEARFLNHETGTADKCTFCVQRLEAGLLPACVETCVGGARVFGDLKDPNSEINQLIKKHDTKGLKPSAGTGPQVFYIGLDDELQEQIELEEAAAKKLRDTAVKLSHSHT